jgi:predicted dienelactone hydrolase
MKRFLFALALFVPGQAMAAAAPGLITEDVNAPHHGRDMNVAIWYPGTGGNEQLFADNPIFQGGQVLLNATPSPGKHPVVLLSHGMGGSYLSLNWLASGLAAKGAIVVAVNHPNGWFKDRQIDKLFNHWTRAQDLSVALDAVLADTRFAGVIDKDRVYATGFSFGGWTALSLGGAIAGTNGSEDYCASAGERSHNCLDLKHFGVDPAKTQPALWRASYKDARVKAVAAIDPGLTWGMTADDVKDLDQSKLLLIALGTGPDQHYATDVTARGSNLVALVPEAHLEVMSPATHFTAMPICKPQGAAILAEEKDDPVCTDPAGTDRHAVHDKIIDLIGSHFGLQ